MNKELFVSSTPHETKVGLVEDDLLAEVYLERENEYTLAGSIYKGRVTRVLPGMQSAFVDIGLERDAFLYVSDFMDLEEHDDDLTDVIPANRGVQDLRQAPQVVETAPLAAEPAEAEDTVRAEAEPASSEQDFDAPESQPQEQASGTSLEASESGSGGDSQQRGRGNFRGRRRRSGRRDGRERGFDRNADRDRSSEARPSEARPSRPAETSYSRPPAAPPPDYEPILLPGESISKYRRSQQAPVAEVQSETETEVQAEVHTQLHTQLHTEDQFESQPEPTAETIADVRQEVPLAATFPEDEPILAESQAAEPLHEEHEDIRAAADEPVESASTNSNWNQEFRQREAATAPALAWTGESVAEVVTPTEPEPASEPVEQDLREAVAHEETHQEVTQEAEEREAVSAHTDRSSYWKEPTPAFAAPGTIEEETIDDEEAEAVHYGATSDDSYDEFEEETQNAGQPFRLNGDAREAVAEIHLASLAEGEAPVAEGTSTHSEEDNEDLELEEAQAEAEAILDAEARGNGTVDARVEVRAPSGTAGYNAAAPAVSL